MIWNQNRWRFLSLVLFSALIVSVLASGVHRSRWSHDIVLAAGNADGESYILCAALKSVIEARYPRLRVTLLETGGTRENLQLLDRGQVDLATAQADAPPDSPARLVAHLFDDTFQLVVREESGIRSVADLKGKRIALASSGGQFQSFLNVTDHFGLAPRDFTVVGEDDRSAAQALIEGRADALFRVRALGNQAIAELITHRNLRLAEIGQAAAMQIRWPAYMPALIPAGAYSGNPPIPDRDLATVAVKRGLLARENVPDEVVWAIAETLTASHHELSQAIPERFAPTRSLLAQTGQPDSNLGLGPALHPGAENYYNRNKPSFIQENADFLGFILTLLLLVGSWLWELKRWVERKQKNQSDVYIHRAVTLMNEVMQATEPRSLESIRRRLFALLAEAVGALDEDRLSEESFQTFRGVLQIAQEVAAERALTLRAEAEAGTVELPAPPVPKAQ